MDSLNFAQAKRKIKFNINCGFCVVRKFISRMRRKVQLVFFHAKRKLPFNPPFFPFIITHFITARLNEVLHFHLLKLTHTEQEILRVDFIAESLANLRYSKR